MQGQQVVLRTEDPRRAELEVGVEVFRTGGAVENAAILATNRSLGYVIDEEWVTLAPPL